MNDYFNMDCYIIRGLKTQIIKENLILTRERKIDEKYKNNPKINTIELKQKIEVMYYYSEINKKESK